MQASAGALFVSLILLQCGGGNTSAARAPQATPVRSAKPLPAGTAVRDHEGLPVGTRIYVLPNGGRIIVYPWQRPPLPVARMTPTATVVR